MMGNWYGCCCILFTNYCTLESWNFIWFFFKLNQRAVGNSLIPATNPPNRTKQITLWSTQKTFWKLFDDSKLLVYHFQCIIVYMWVYHYYYCLSNACRHPILWDTRKIIKGFCVCLCLSLSLSRFIYEPILISQFNKTIQYSEYYVQCWWWFCYYY